MLNERKGQKDGSVYLEDFAQEDLAIMYCQIPELKQRGWTDLRIQKYLKVAAYFRDPELVTKPPLRLYERTEVERIEATSEWQESKRKWELRQASRKSMKFAIMKAEAYVIGYELRKKSGGGYEIELGYFINRNLRGKGKYCPTLEAVRLCLDEIENRRANSIWPTLDY